MERNVRMEDISDGRLYGLNDMVKAGCNDCRGCYACCCNMGDSIITDPLDIHRLCVNLGCTMEQLLADKIALGVYQGIILPHIKMTGADGACGFLDENKRCSVHSFRPGICRLFPLGRYYEEDGSFSYFLQVHECKAPVKTKVKVKKWIDVENVEENTRYICLWHNFVKKLQQAAAQLEENALKQVNMYVLQEFFFKGYGADFYGEFEERLAAAKEILKKSGVSFE